MRRLRRLRLQLLEQRLMLAADVGEELGEEEDDFAIPELLRDINQVIPDSGPIEFVKSGDKIFVSADDGIHGHELFVTDGESPPTLVKDIRFGSGDSVPQQMVDVDGVLYFVADNFTNGKELWKSDGTEAGTTLVADIFVGRDGSNPSSLTVAQTDDGAKLFFTADHPDHGLELWMADDSGASLVTDIWPGNDGPDDPNDSFPQHLTFWPEHIGGDGETVDPAIYFSAATESAGRELWRTTIVGGNTSTTLVKNLFADQLGSEPNSSNPNHLVVFNGLLYFAAEGGEFNETEGKVIGEGTELWRSNGTAEGTELVADLRPGFQIPAEMENPFGSFPRDMTSHNEKLYFSALTTSEGRELWSIDGGEEAEPQLVRNIRGGTASSSPADFTSTDGFLFFTANGGQGKELWRTDGTFAGTQITRDIRPGSGTSMLFTRGFTALGSSVIFGADDGNLGPEVWISDGTLSGTKVLEEIQFGRNSSNVPSSYTTIDDAVYFEASEQIWKTDGTGAGTDRFPLQTEATLGSIAPNFDDVSPRLFARANNLLFFAADDGINGNELWKSDGSTAGTTMVTDLAPGTSITFPGSSIETPNSSNPEQLLAVGDKVFFRTESLLRVTDGTESGTISLGNHSPTDLTRFGNTLYFSGDGSTGIGRELWMSDGTIEGTVPVIGIGDGFQFQQVDQLTVVGDKLFFVADTANGNELWVTDGTVDGTTEFNLAESFGSYPEALTPVGDKLFFRANDGVHGPELWVSDATVEGTILVKDIRLVPEGEEDFFGSSPVPLAGLGGELLFFADDRVTGQKLWKSDGTENGTVVVKDIWSDPYEEEFDSGETGTGKGRATVFDGKVFFAADDGNVGAELWSSDGTAAGTNLFEDLFPGDDSSFPSDLTVVGSNLYFAANEEHPVVSGAFGGRELWVSDGTAAFTCACFETNAVDGNGLRPRSLQSIGGTLYFVANDGVHGDEVYTSGLRLKADDFLFEILARDIAYRESLIPGGTPIAVGDEIILQNLGYDSPFAFTVSLVVHDNDTGFDAYGLVADNADPILAIRGSAGIDDFFSDLMPEGVGVNQFDANQTELFSWLNSVSLPNRRPSVTGHSLGGALTQLLAAAYTADDKELAQVVSFNAPGISEQRAGLFDSGKVERVMHYITNGDPVSLAGDAFIEGRWRRSDFEDLLILHNHQFPVLVDFTIADDPEAAEVERRLRSESLTFTDYEDTSWLNHPFYFHTDSDYFFWLAAAQTIVSVTPPLQQFSDIPGRLIFRSTTEAERQRVGEAILELQEEIDETIDTFTCQSPNSTVTAPDFDIDLLNILQVQATELSASCVAGPPHELRLQGRVVLPQIKNATADFAGDNYIGLREDGFDLVGRLSIEDLTLVPGFWKLFEVFVDINTVENKIVAGGSMEIPTGITLDAEVEFLNNNFNRVLLRTPSEEDPDPVNQPLGPTGIFLQGIEGQVDNVANPTDENPVEFSGGLTATGGPTITVPLPSWAGGTWRGKLIEFDVSGSLDKNHIEASGDVDLVQGLARVDGQVEVNWNEGYFESSGQLNVLDGLITSSGSFRADSNLNVNLFSDATFGIPDELPLIGGYDAVSGKFVLDYTNDSNSSNDFVAAWTTFDLLFVGETNLGFRVFFDGSFGTIGADEVAAITPQSGLAAGEQVAGAGSYEIAPDTDWALFSVAWDGGATDRTIVLTTPSGETVTEADLSSRSDIDIVPDLTTEMRRVVVVEQPEAGQWMVAVNDDSSLSNLRVHAFVHNESPTVDVSATDGLDGVPVEIMINANDPDSEATVALYYDTDNQGFDGIRIVGGLNESDGQYTWTPSSLVEGDYFVYAVIDDGVNPVELSYAGEAISISPGPKQVTVFLPVDGGVFETLVENDEFVVRESGGQDIFRQLESKLLGVDIIGVANVADTVLANLNGISVPVSLNGGNHGQNEFKLAGSGQLVDLTQADELSLANVDLIDITGNGGNQIVVGADEVQQLSPNDAFVQLQHDENDQVDYSGEGWEVQDPIFAGGRQWHVLTNGDSRIETANTLPYQNPLVRADVNYDGGVTALDALLVINYLGRFDTIPVDLLEPTSFDDLAQRYYDVNGSGTATALDALQVINFLGRITATQLSSGEQPVHAAPVDRLTTKQQADDLLEPEPYLSVQPTLESESTSKTKARSHDALFESLARSAEEEHEKDDVEIDWQLGVDDWMSFVGKGGFRTKR